MKIFFFSLNFIFYLVWGGIIGAPPRRKSVTYWFLLNDGLITNIFKILKISVNATFLAIFYVLQFQSKF